MIQPLIKKIVLVLSFSLISYTISAQSAVQRQQLALADSLGQTHHFEEAHALTDQLLEGLDDSAVETQLFLLEVQQVKAQVYEKQDKLKEALTICLNILEKGEQLGHVKIMCSAQLTLALIYEKLKDFDRCSEVLAMVDKMISTHDLVDNYAHYCIRKSSFFRLTQERDSSIYYAKKGLQFANKYDQDWHRNDAYLLLGHLHRKHQRAMAKQYYKLAIKEYLNRTKYDHASVMYYSIASMYVEDSLHIALAYADTAVQVHSLSNKAIPHYFHKLKSQIYHELGEYDLAMVYADHRAKAIKAENIELHVKEIDRLTVAFETKQKEAALVSQVEINKKQGKLLLQSIVLICVVVLTLVLLFLAYRKVKQNNKTINCQSLELQSSLKQKNVLLAEVQHRVKNNLQLIIALLDLQKEAAAGKSIEDITNESQKRIESISFLHDKIYLSKDLSHVDLQNYLTEITGLMHNSFEARLGHVKVIVTSEIDTILIETAIPLGLITVELLNNSYKYAFQGRDAGEIRIQIYREETDKRPFSFEYSDNGVGYTKPSSNGGLGQEIIRGLVSQLHGSIVFDGSDGFRAKISF